MNADFDIPTGGCFAYYVIFRFDIIVSLVWSFRPTNTLTTYLHAVPSSFQI